jgi:hypothetical protein
VVGKKAQVKELQHFQDKVDHIITCLICVCDLVPNLIDSPEWKELLTLLNSNYHIMSGDTFANKYIPQKAVFVSDLQIKILKELNDLTLTFDRTTICKPHSLYTVHVTTPTHKSYFLGGHEGSDE